MAQPTEIAIQTVIDITGFEDKQIVASALQAKNNNVEAVMNDYFDSPDRVGLAGYSLLSRPR